MNCTNYRNDSNNKSIIRSNHRLHACHTVPMKMMTTMTPIAAASSARSSCSSLAHCVVRLFYASHGVQLAVHCLAIDHVWRVSSFAAQVAPLAVTQWHCDHQYHSITSIRRWYRLIDSWIQLVAWSMPCWPTHTRTKLQNYSAEIFPAHCSFIYILPAFVFRYHFTFVFFFCFCLDQCSANLWIIYLFAF